MRLHRAIDHFRIVASPDQLPLETRVIVGCLDVALHRSVYAGRGLLVCGPPHAAAVVANTDGVR